MRKLRWVLDTQNSINGNEERHFGETNDIQFCSMQNRCCCLLEYSTGLVSSTKKGATVVSFGLKTKWSPGNPVRQLAVCTTINYHL